MTTPLCRKRIILTVLSETYCMRNWGHKGLCSPQLDTHTPIPPRPVATGTTTPLKVS